MYSLVLIEHLSFPTQSQFIGSKAQQPKTQILYKPCPAKKARGLSQSQKFWEGVSPNLLLRSKYHLLKVWWYSTLSYQLSIAHLSLPASIAWLKSAIFPCCFFACPVVVTFLLLHLFLLLQLFAPLPLSPPSPLSPRALLTPRSYFRQLLSYFSY